LANMKQPATEEDLKAGRAIFYISGNRSAVYELGRPLPIAARIKQDIETSTAQERNVVAAGTPVEIVQCEIDDKGKILVGFRFGAGGGICTLDEVEMTSSE
jgi:hypothetical protein